MKKYILLIAAAALLYVNKSHGQEYKPTIEKTFLAFDTNHTNQAQKVEQSNKLALIAKKWPDEWTAHYYNAYSKVTLSYDEKDAAKKDAYLEEAEKEHDEAVTLLGKENDETYVLAAMTANARMAVNPQERWQKYGKLFEDNLKKAKEVNEHNPRIYYLQGTSKFFTPKQWGGGKKAALPYFEKAQPLFEKEDRADIAKPHWGREANAYFLGQSKGEDKE